MLSASNSKQIFLIAITAIFTILLMTFIGINSTNKIIDSTEDIAGHAFKAELCSSDNDCKKLGTTCYENKICLTQAQIKRIENNPLKNQILANLFDQSIKASKEKVGETTQLGCQDSDTSKVNYFNYPFSLYQFINVDIKGTIQGIDPSTKKPSMYEDRCWSSTRVLEYFCDLQTGMISWNSFDCPEKTVCEDGLCKKTDETITITEKAIEIDKVLEINVKQIGARADGITDDGSLFQKALDELSEKGGGKLFIPQGTYLIDTSLIVDSNIEIYGQGETSLLRRGPTPSYVPLYLGEDCEEKSAFKGTPLFWNSKYNCGNQNIVIRDLHIDGSLVDIKQLPKNMYAGGPMIAFSAIKDTHIKNIKITNAPQDGIFFRNGGVRTSITDSIIDGALMQWGNGRYINIEMHSNGNFHTEEEPVHIENNQLVIRSPGFCHEGGDESLRKQCTQDSDCKSNKCSSPSEIAGIGATVTAINDIHDFYPSLIIKNNEISISNKHTAINCYSCKNSMIVGNNIKAMNPLKDQISGLYTGISVSGELVIKNNELIGSNKPDDGRGILVDGGSNSIVEDNTIINKDITFGLAQIELRGQTNFQIKNNKIMNGAGGHGIVIGSCQKEVTTEQGMISGNGIDMPRISGTISMPLVLRRAKDMTTQGNIVTPKQEIQIQC
ncbi:right-handed parallel beta-helix repeat-containing protein [Candidatus Woesearchaeota archaeon]|nr:right-handed parallel beta-helix repeat-containing protein [Candidatus Woesearchaeota archaeon]